MKCMSSAEVKNRVVLSPKPSGVRALDICVENCGVQCLVFAVRTRRYIPAVRGVRGARGGQMQVNRPA